MELRRYRRFVALACQVLALVLVAGTVRTALASPAPNHIVAELVAGPAATPGARTTIAIRMTPEAGWHGYWVNPGDAGLGMQLDWTLPEGAKTGEPRYPVPQTLLVQGLMNHVFESEYAVLVPFTVPARATPGSRLPVRVKAQWLACTDQICVPERAELSAEVTVSGPGDPPLAVPPGFAQWGQRLPAPLDRAAAIAFDARELRLAIPLPRSVKLESPHVFVREDKLVDYAAPQLFARKGDLLLVTIPRARFEPRDAAGLTGVLKLDSAGNGIAFAAQAGKVPVGGVPIMGEEAVASGGALPALPWLLLAAVAGGLLLNVMPCVFPILSLKALSLARAGESQAHARIEGLAYAAGVIAACLALGGVLLMLRASGEQVGWAFQLQEPIVVIALLLLAGAITANLLGVFEFAAPGFATEGSPQGAFATGLLAAFVATPCTGPFMASAMGAALLLPVLPAMALFAALGLGIALPFLAVAFIPALRTRLPRPGRWMATFRRWMAIPMGLTVLALAWLVWKIGGPTYVAAVLALGTLMLAALAAGGRAQRAGRSGRAGFLAAIALPAAGLVLLPSPTPSAPEIAGVLNARPFSEDALASARRGGKPVFVYMTADWCLTCKVNEQVAIEREETRAAFDKAGVIVLRGDWTRRDPAITRYLTAQGAAGVPLYVWYGRDGRAEQLPQVLTPTLLAKWADR